MLNGLAAGDGSGWSVSGAGDMNGDGFTDLLIGARGANPNGSISGQTYVVFGGPANLAALDTAGGEAADGRINLSALDGTTGFVLNGITAGDDSGLSVSGAGDVNGDGFADLLIGAPGADPNGSYSGQSYVVFGGQTNLAALDTAGGGAADGLINLSALDGTTGFVLNGITAGDDSGLSVSGAGDVNGDGFDDLLIGAWSADPNGSQSGQSYVVFGGQTNLAALDTAGGGAADGRINLSALDGTTGFVLNGLTSLDYSGYYALSGAGDVNGDGFADLLIGALGADPNGTRSGQSYVVFGGQTNLAALDTAGGEAADGRIELFALDGTTGFVVNGLAAYDYSGNSVSGAGDVNGDGFADLLIGAFGADPNGLYSGQSYVVFGGNFTNSATQVGTTNADTLTGSAAVDVLVGGRGNDTIVGNGGADVLYGGAGDDVLAVSTTTFARIDGGNGSDTLRLDGSGLTLNLTTLADSTLTNIETIDIRGSGANTLTLNLQEVLNVTQPSNAAATSNTLTVFRNADDTVNIGGGWTQQADVVIGGLTFHVSTQGAATLKVQFSNQTPVFTSTATPSVPENTTSVLTVTATDADLPAQTPTFSLTGGADQAKFAIISGGVLTFVAAPDFENPTDANADNVYLVQVTANDGAGGTAIQTLSVTVTSVNDNNPVFTSTATPSVPENTTSVLTVTATDADLPAQTVTFSLTGGADQAKFAITSGGVLTFLAAPDFESPTDANGDNVYLVQVTASDGAGGTAIQTLSVTVTSVNDNNPVFTSTATPSVPENTTSVLTVTATDADLPAQTPTFSLTGGADQAKFAITSGGVLTFVAAPNYESPTDANADNVYLVQVTASDGAGGTTVQTLSVTVTDVVELDIRVLSAIANGQTTLTVTYQIVGVAAPAFNLGAYSSSDETFDGDALLGTVAITAPADLTVGTHIKTWTIGSSAGQIPLPGAGAAELNTDYFLLLVADPTDAVAETDPGGINEDNVAVFTGVYHAAAGQVLVQGGTGTDTVSVSGSIGVTVNGTPYTYTAGDVAGLRVRTHAGDDTVNAAALTKVLAAWGGTGIDTLTGGSAADLLSGGAGNDTLVGGAGNDTYTFAADVDLGSDTLNESGGGTDTLDFSATTGIGVAVNLGLATAQTVNANLTLTLGSTTTFENVIGGAQGDTLTGNANVNTLTGGGGDDVLVGGAGNDTLIGGAGNDTYAFAAATALGTDTLNETGGGIDTLDLSGTTSLAVAVNLGLATSQTVNANLKLILGSATTFENVIGGALNDTLTGNSLSNVLTGGAGNDKYVLDADSALGSDTLDEGGGGTDTLDFSLTTTQAVAVNLGLTTAQVVNPNLTLTLLAGNVIENATGGSLNDTLTGNTLANLLTGNAGNDTLAGAGGNDTLIGGAGNDTYAFSADSALGSDTLDESGGGIDTLDFSSTTTLGIGVNLEVATAQTVNANLTLTLGSTTTFENAAGGAQGDTITGNANANVLTGGGGNDVLNAAAGNDTLVGGAGNDTLVGAAGNDLYLFAADSPLGSDTLDESGGGTDTLDFSATTGLGIGVNLGVATVQTVNANLALTLGSASTFENVVGGAQGDTLTGNSLANTITGGAGDDTLAGGTGNDVYVFDTDSALGSDNVIEAVGAGTDLLDFSQTTNLGVAVDLSSVASQIVNSNLTLTLSAGGVFENATGGALNDVLTGNALANVLTGGAGDDTLTGAAGNDTLTGGAGDDTLIGGDGTDAYVFDADTALGSDTLVESTTGGGDTLNFSTTTTAMITLDLSSAIAQVVNSNLTLTLENGGVFENVSGGSLDDVITGNALANTLTGNAGNDTLTGADGADVLIGGTGNDTLVGGNGNDVYTFDADTALGSDSINEAASGGTDLLDFSLTTTLGVTIDLSSIAAQVVNGNLVLMLSAGDVIDNVTGGSLNDTLTGNGLANVLTGNADNDTLTGSDGNDTLLGGAGNDTLDGGNGDDVYSFDADAALGSDTLVEGPGPVGGVDLLDFSQTTTLAVSIDLASTAAQVANSNLTVTLWAGDVFEMVVGTSLNDTLRGNLLNNVLIGGAGADSLFGFGGRNLLVGGTGVGSLMGGDEDDVLISGIFSYFNESTKTLNRPAIDAIMAEWTRTDVAADYATRIAHLRTGGGLNGSTFLNSLTVLTDGSAIDTLFGEAGLDWFWKFGSDSIGDQGTGGTEQVN